MTSQLGAFGFMSSDEIFRNGVVNAGLLDQHFALQWVQAYISLFGGNASQVSISGESAGGGSVMLQDMAYGGSQGDSLFVNVSQYGGVVITGANWSGRRLQHRRTCQCSTDTRIGFHRSPTTHLASKQAVHLRQLTVHPQGRCSNVWSAKTR